MDLRFSHSTGCIPTPCFKASRLCPQKRRCRLVAAHALYEVPTPSQQEIDTEDEATRRIPTTSSCGCACCGRRLALGALAGALSSTSSALAFSGSNDDAQRFAETVHPARPRWYEEFYAAVMNYGMVSYEKQMERNKAQLFASLGDEAHDVLEVGIGTGPNIKYYAKKPELSIMGVDPNQQMEKYARAAASAAGLKDSQFKFVHAVGEALPVDSSSMDAVICTLVLCSVKDVAATLKEVKRVLRPGGSFLFIEHVAAPEGSRLRFWQDILNPVQQFVADGCHLNRNTLDDIRNASFRVVKADNIDVPSVSILSPHIIGMAQA